MHIDGITLSELMCIYVHRVPQQAIKYIKLAAAAGYKDAEVKTMNER
jgi:hypothetical protein